MSSSLDSSKDAVHVSLLIKEDGDEALATLPTTYNSAHLVYTDSKSHMQYLAVLYTKLQSSYRTKNIVTATRP